MVDILYDLFIRPLIFVIDFVFSISFKLLDNPGLSIIVVSIVVNAICIPLYAMADARQEEERARQAKMERWVTHIKKTFVGDERYMMLNAYYEEQGYKQWYALGSSVSLLLQIPIFMAAYSYLSNLDALSGASFLFIGDLGKPDALLPIGNMRINVLPVVMTLLNFVSSAIYTRGLPIKDKVQPFGLAALFLVLLYHSPSGLVFYWTCNQVFSLARNVLTKLVHPSVRATTVILQIVVLVVAALLMWLGVASRPKRLVGLVLLVVGAEFLLVRSRQSHGEASEEGESRSYVKEFVLASLFLSVLVGAVIPSALFVSSPAQFVAACSPSTPVMYVLHVFCVATGFFMLWGGVFFWLSSARGKRGMACGWWVLSGVCLADYFVEYHALGVINTTLVYDNSPKYSTHEQLLAAVAVCVAIAGLLLVWRRIPQVVNPALAIMTIAMVALVMPRMLEIHTATAEVLEASNSEGESRANGNLFNSEGNPLPIIKLSKTGKNVVMLYLDRGISCYVPYMFNERPELAQKYDGFVYYPNTISFGEYTVLGSPAVYGGYDYTVTAMNERDDELLIDKHRNALLLMPRLFSDAGYKVTMIDGPDVNYRYVGSDFPEIETVENATYYHAAGAYNEYVVASEANKTKERFQRNIVYYSLFCASPAFVRGAIYDKGSYLAPQIEAGYPSDFLNHYSAVKMLPQITTVDEESSGDLILFDTEETHEPAQLNLPDYTLEPTTEEAIAEDYDRFTLDGKSLRMDGDTRIQHYHVNMAAFLMLGDWLDTLRTLGVYDNTRIVIVSDHGRGMHQSSDLLVPGLIDGETFDAEWVNPVFMVKDFDAHGFSTSNEFMTNADTPSIMMEGIVKDPVNPDTGNPVNTDEKTAHDQIISTSHNWNLGKQRNLTVYDTSDGEWVSVHDSIFDVTNWSYLGK